MPERLARELRVVHELADIVAAGPYSGEDVLRRTAPKIQDAFGFERTILARLEPEPSVVRGVVLEGLDWPGDAGLRLSELPLLEQALEQRRAVLSHDAGAEGALPSAIVERFGVGAIVAVPLLVGERCWGFLVGDRRGGALDLSQDDLDLLTAIGVILGVFTEKAEAFERLQRLDDVKTDFISIASHELRSPISVVHGIAATLHRHGSRLAEEQLVELRNTLYEQTSRLRALTEGLLDLSRLDSGAFSPEPRPLRPRECVEELLPQIVPDRLADVRVEIPPELEVVADADACERIVSNLVVNAFRYGRPPVTIAADVAGDVRIVVEDRGPGVAADFVPRLFERFSRSDQSRLRAAGGAGLGLSIARSYAEAIGGDLRYERAEPTGARFVFTLPAAARP